MVSSKDGLPSVSAYSLNLIRMRFVFFSLLISLQVAAQPATFTGTFPPEYAGKEIKLTLINYETRDDKLLQQVTIGAAGKFKITIPSKEPEIYNIGVGDSSVMQVLARPGDRINAVITRDQINVTGSKETGYLVDYERNRKIIFNKYLKRTYDSSAAAVASGDKDRIEYWNAEHEKASENYKAELSKWVEQPFFINSLAAVHHSIRWHPENDSALMNQMVAIYQTKYPGYDLTRQLVNKVTVTKRIAIGAVAPGFTSTNTEDKNIGLNNYRGKYTLVDFWASWCAPCREESPTLVRLYNEYRNRGFEILSVSIDTDSVRWKNAVQKDGYTWENVFDAGGYSGTVAALYAVTAIPATFLLDKDGKIISKNLRGKMLEDKLAALMK